MRTIKAKAGQTLSDIAVCVFGFLEAVTEIARLNGIPITEKLKDGQELRLPEIRSGGTMQKFCQDKNISCATEIDTASTMQRIFTKEFQKEFR